MLVLARWPEEAREFRQEALRLASAVLNLGHGVAFAAGLDRYQQVPARSERVHIPSTSAMTQASSVFLLTDDDMHELMGDDPTVLAELEWDLGVAPLPGYEGRDDPLERTPIIKRGHQHVLASPTALPVALRHALVNVAIKHGWREQLAEQLRRRAVAAAISAAERMDWTRGDVLAPAAGGQVVSALFGFDGDKVAHLAVICDDLADYDPDDSRGQWGVGDLSQELLEAFKEVEERYTFGEGARVNDFVHVVVLAGVGRLCQVFLPELPTPTGAPHVLLSLESLDCISMLGPDRLELWKFARAGDRLRERTQVMAFDTLDEYRAWRDHHRSFYMGDDGRATFLGIDPDHGLAVRLEMFRAPMCMRSAPPGGRLNRSSCSTARVTCLSMRRCTILAGDRASAP